MSREREQQQLLQNYANQNVCGHAEQIWTSRLRPATKIQRSRPQAVADSGEVATPLFIGCIYNQVKVLHKHAYF